MDKNLTQSQSVRPDQGTQNWTDLWRRLIAGTAGSITGNKALQNYGGMALALPDYGAGRTALENTFNRQRDLAGLGADSYSTGQGAYGGDRSALFKESALNDVNLNEGNTMANYNLNATNETWGKLLQLLGLGNGLAGTGSTTTTQMPSNPLGQLLGLGVTGAGVAGGLGWKPFA